MEARDQVAERAPLSGRIFLRARVGWLLVGLLALGLGLLGYAFLVGPRRLVVNRQELALPRWPAELAGLKVALLSDLHVGSPHWTLARAAELVARVNAEQPDLVLLAGDYVIAGVVGGDPVEAEPIARVLGGLRAPAGVVAVLGNHDWWYDGERLTRAFRAQGIIVLEDDVRELRIRGQRLCSAGVGDLLTRAPSVRAALDRAPAGCPVVVLMHEPDLFPLVDDRALLTVAGHTHGGQVALPLVGRPIVPSKYGERYAAGLVVENGHRMFVTTGVGTSIFPVRFGVPPEVALLRLR